MEHVGDKLLAMCSQHNLEEYNNFQMTYNKLLEKVQDIRRIFDESYNKITKHDIEQLTKFQVSLIKKFSLFRKMKTFSIFNLILISTGY